jgi:hypothetical protein
MLLFIRARSTPRFSGPAHARPHLSLHPPSPAASWGLPVRQCRHPALCPRPISQPLPSLSTSTRRPRRPTPTNPPSVASPPAPLLKKAPRSRPNSPSPLRCRTATTSLASASSHRTAPPLTGALSAPPPVTASASTPPLQPLTLTRR